MNSKKFTMLASIIAVAMMLCVAITPMVSFDSNVSATDESDGGIKDSEYSVSGITNSDYNIESIIEKLKADITEFVTDTGIKDAISSALTRETNVFGDTVTISEVETIADGKTLDLAGETTRVSLKFTGDGKYVIEKGGSVLLCDTLKLEGEGTIIEMKEGSLIKFTSDADGYKLPGDCTISLDGTFESSLNVGKDNAITAKMNVDLKGTLTCDDLEIVNDGDLLDVTVESKVSINIPEINTTAGITDIIDTSFNVNFTAKAKSVTITANKGDTDEKKIVFSDVNVSVDYNGDKNTIVADAEGKVTVKSKNVIIATVTFDINANVSYDADKSTVTADAECKVTVESKDVTATATFKVSNLKISGVTVQTDKNEALTGTANDAETDPATTPAGIGFSGNVNFSLSASGKNVNTNVNAGFDITEGKYTGDSFSATVKANIPEFKVAVGTDAVDASGIEASLIIKKEITPETSDIKDVANLISLIQPESYISVKSAVIKTESTYAKVTDAKVSLVDVDDVTKVDAYIGTFNLNGKVSGYDKTTIEMSKISVLGTLDGKTITVSGDRILCDMKPLMSKNMHISAEDFTAEKDGDKVIFKNGTYEIKDATSYSAEMVISKDAKVTVDAVKIDDEAILTVEDGNKNINGKFTMLPGSTYNYGTDKTIEVSGSQGCLAVAFASGEQTLSVEPISAGFKLVESKEELPYTVNEDGTGTFTDAEPSGTLCAMSEYKSFKVTINGEEISVDYSDNFKFPEAPTPETGKVFLGWTDGYRIYHCGDSLIMPAKDMTFTAAWSDTVYTVDKEGKSYIVTKDTAESLVISADDITKMIEKIGESKDVTFDIKTGSFTVSFDSNAAAGFDDELSIAVKQVKTDDINDNVVYAVEDGALYTIDATCGGTEVHTFSNNGTAKVTVIYELKDGQKASDLTGYYLYYLDTSKSSASLDPVETSVKDLGDGKVEVTMTLEHFSDYIVKEKATVGPTDEGSGDNGMSLGVTVGVIAAIIVILAIAGVVLMKRKG